MQKNEIAIVILSCDKFKITWKPCIDHFFNSWSACPYPVYLLNNLVSSNDKRVIDLMTGQDENWSDSVIKGLQKIKSKRVFFIFDDSFITKMQVEKIKYIFETAVRHDLASVALLKKKFDRGEELTNEVFKLSKKTKYRNSLFLNLIKRDILLRLLKSGENAWQFEKIGSRRSESLDFYSVNSSDLVRFHHGIVKGKWLPKTYNYLLSQGYDLSENNFEVYNKIQVAKMKLHEMVFYGYHKIFHLLNRYRMIL